MDPWSSSTFFAKHVKKSILCNKKAPSGAKKNGDNETRTHDPLLARQVL
jgi:hypothetical protein